MGFYSGGLIIGRIFASEIWGVYFREGLFEGGDYYRNFTVYFHLARILYKCSVQMNFANSTEGRGDRRTVILSVGL